MSLPPPRLDDADAVALISSARARLAERGAGWQPEALADPGTALLEAFAQVTAEELERLNRLPSALQSQFLSLLGVTLDAGRAETVRLAFDLPSPRGTVTTIAAGLRVAAPDLPGIVFTLIETVEIAPGATRGEGLAAHLTRVENAHVATGSGVPGQRASLPHGDIPAAPAVLARIDLRVAVPEAGPDDVMQDGRAWRRLEEVGRIAPGATRPVFAADRVTGQISFALDGPGLPVEGAEIRADYWHGAPRPGGAPLAPNQLTAPLDPLPGVQVTNPAPSTPPLPSETVEARLAKGPLDLLASDMAFRARDYEALAERAHPAVARAHAVSTANWAFVDPGLVRVLVAPYATSDANGAIDDAAIEAARNDPEILTAVKTRLDAALPLGARVEVGWLPAKTVAVDFRAYVSAGTDLAAMERALRQRLARYLNPVNGPEGTPRGDWPEGWPMGRTLRQSEVIETLLGVPGLRAVDRVSMRPRYPMEGRVTAIAADCEQRGVWFVAMGGALHRSLDDGQGWTRAPLPDGIGATGERVASVATHPTRTGLVAAVTESGAVFVSRDCGQSFAPFAQAAPGVTVARWADGAETPRLLLAGAAPLSETAGPSTPDAPPAPARSLMAQDGIVGPAYAMADIPDHRGGRMVAVARRGLAGVVISNDSGWDGGFEPAGLAGQDIRALAFTRVGDVLWLVAGAARPLSAGRHGAWVTQVDPDTADVLGWQPCDGGLPPVSIECLHARDDLIFAGTRGQGLIEGRLDAGGQIAWTLPPEGNGLPRGLGERGMAPIVAIADAPWGIALLGGEGELLAADDAGHLAAGRVQSVAIRDGAERITLPADWTLMPGDHRIELRHVQS